MRARIWGCRGSIAAPGPQTLRYGGNTSCVEMRLEDGSLIIFDAGTGILPLATHLAGEEIETLHLMLTHLHLDHLQGLGFFEPLVRSGTQIHIWGPTSSMKDLRSLIERYLSPPLFPLPLLDLTSQISYHNDPYGGWEIGEARFFAQSVTHHGPTIGYRIEEDGRSLVYIPDHEPGRGLDLADKQSEWISGFDLAFGADILMHDSQYTTEEYQDRKGWGHSSIHDAVTFAKRVEAKKLLMFHHDPLHSDEDLEELERLAAELWGDEDPPVLAREGMEITLTREGASLGG